MTSTPLLASNLWKRLGRNWVLKGVSFSISEPKILVVLGPNGAGKTTLLRVLAGLYKPDKGVVRIYGLEPRLAARKGLIAYLPDEAGLYPRLRGDEHLKFYLSLYGRRPRREIVESLGVHEFANRALSEYSRGMKKRLELAMVLSTGCKVCLLDEPLTGLDLPSIRAALRSLRLVVEEGSVVVVTTHDIWVAEHVADTILVLDSGVVVAFEELERVKSRFGSLELFLEEVVYRR